MILIIYLKKLKKNLIMIYNKIIKNISSFIPEFTKKEQSILIKNKKILFNITQELTSSINSEIIDINKNAISLSDIYSKEKLYYFHYDLYNFRKSFLDGSLNDLLNEYEIIVKKIMKKNYINLIDENYELAFEYLDQENNLMNSLGGNLYIGSGFIDRYQKLYKTFKEFMSLSFSDEFIELLEGYFYQIKNDILNYVDSKLKSIIKYNFEEEIIKNNFYLIEQIYNEIYSLIDNMNNIFNEVNFAMKIKVEALNIGMDIIKPYDEEKEKILSNLYDKLNKRLDNRVHGTSSDLAKRVKKHRKARRLWKSYFVFYDYNCKSRNNVNKINNNLSKIDKELSTQVNTLINSFINTFEPYLSGYIILTIFTI